MPLPLLKRQRKCGFGKAKVEAEIEAEKDKLRSLKEETAHLKRTVTALINRFTGELDEFASE